jgi:hypothetical protein
LPWPSSSEEENPQVAELIGQGLLTKAMQLLSLILLLWLLSFQIA